MNFGKVTPELIQLICKLLVRHGKNWRIQSNNSLYTGQTLTIVYRMKALRVQMIDLELVFRFFKGRCHRNQFWAKFAK